MTSMFLKFINIILTIIISGMLGFFCAAFYLGTPEQHQDMINNNLAEGFFSRFIIFWLVGLVFILILTLLNFIFNKTFNKTEPLRLWYIFLGGLLTLTVSCLIGGLYFFRIFFNQPIDVGQ
mgnify:CR=1 FL=1